MISLVVFETSVHTIQALRKNNNKKTTTNTQNTNKQQTNQMFCWVSV